MLRIEINHSVMKNILYSIFVLVFLISSIASHGQEEQERQVSPEGFTFNPKIGVFLGTTIFKVAGGFIGIEASYRKNNNIHSLSIDFMRQYMIFSSPDNTYKQLNYLYGRYHDMNKVRFQYQIGVGVFFGKVQDKLIRRDPGFLGHEYYTMRTYSRMALPLELGIKRLLKNGHTLGLDININMNREFVVIMPALSFEF